MFKELLPMLNGRTAIMTVAKLEGNEDLIVTVYFSCNGDKSTPLVATMPLCMRGSAEELNQELPGQLAGYMEAVGG